MKIGMFWRGLRGKLVVVFMLIALIPLGSVSLITYWQARRALQTQAMNQLISIRAMKKEALESYFSNIHGQIRTLSNDPTTISALQEFTNAYWLLETEMAITEAQFKGIQDALHNYYAGQFLTTLNQNLDAPQSLATFFPLEKKRIILQHLYIAGNLYPPGEKDNLAAATDASTYTQTHRRYHPILRSFLKEFEYYDIFLVNNSGDIVYTVYKEVDFGTNLLTGPYRESIIGKAFQRAHQAADTNFVTLTDIEPYDPSYHLPNLAIASPIYADEQKIGVLIF